MPIGIGEAIALSAGAQVLGGVMGADASKSAARTQAQSGEAAIAEQRRQFDSNKSDLAPYKNVGTSALYTLRDALGLPGAGTSASDTTALNMAADKMIADKLWAPEFGQQIKDIIAQGPEAVAKSIPWLQSDLVNKGGLDPAAWQGFASPQQTSTPTTPLTGTLTKPFSFDISQDPGYQFRMDQGTKAIESSAAAGSGAGLLSGATMKELMKFGSDYASGEFNNAFNRDMATKNQLYSMLTGTAGIGVGATNTGVSAGTQTATNVGNTMTGIGNANASGMVGSSNAMSGALGGAGNTLVNGMTLRSVLNQNNAVAPITGGVNLRSAGENDVLQAVG